MMLRELETVLHVSASVIG